MAKHIKVEFTIDGDYHEDTDVSTFKEMLVGQIMDTVFDQFSWDTMEDFKIVIDDRDAGRISIVDGNKVQTHHNGLPCDEDGNAIPFSEMNEEQRTQVKRVQRHIDMPLVGPRVPPDQKGNLSRLL